MLSRNENRWDDLIVGPAAAEGVDMALVKAVIWNETRFAWIGDPHPVTGVTITDPAQLDREEPRIGDASIGVMQILTQTAAWVMGVPSVTRETLRDPAENINIGTRILSMYVNGWRAGDGGVRLPISRTFTVEEALAAYNGGPGAVTTHDRTGVYSAAVQAYVTRGMGAFRYFQDVQGQMPAGETPPVTEAGLIGSVDDLTVWGAIGAVLALLALAALRR